MSKLSFNSYFGIDFSYILGDVAPYIFPIAQIVILANDDANGIISFKPPDRAIGSEGEPIRFM